MSVRWPVTAMLLGTITACAPWYRDDELRALRASDREAMGEILARCDGLVQRGSAHEAVGCFEDALERNPLEGPALVGLARSLLSSGQHEQARAVAAHGASVLAGSGDVESRRALAAIVVDSYGRQQLWSLVLQQVGTGTTPELAPVAAQYPAVFGKLGEAQRAAKAGDLATALERYAGWLADYGVPDHRIIRTWCDDVLARTAPRLALTMARADHLAAQGNWIGAVVAYGAAFRYLPSKTFDEQVRSKLVAAAARLEEPWRLSPTAVDAAADARALVERGELGGALRAQRRAVAAAPYWAEARHDLAVTLGSLGLADEAMLQMDWFMALAPASPLRAKAQALRDGWATRQPSAGGTTP